MTEEIEFDMNRKTGEITKIYKKQFNLKERRTKGVKQLYQYVYLEKDIKEFIKLLRLEIDGEGWLHQYREGKGLKFLKEESIENLLEIINKLVGKKWVNN